MCQSGTRWRRESDALELLTAPGCSKVHHNPMNIDTTDSRVRHPKDTAGKKEAWRGRAVASGSPHWKCVRFDDSAENVLSLSFPEPQPQGSCNWLWWVWVMSSGRGRPSGVNWHSSAVTRRPPGSWEPGRCLAFAEGRRKLHRARSLIRPRSRLLCALTCKFGQVPPCWKPCQWFQGEGNWENIWFASGNWISVRKCQSFSHWPRDFGQYYSRRLKACFSPILTKVAVCWIFQRAMMVFKSCHSSSVFVAKHPCHLCQV